MVCVDADPDIFDSYYNGCCNGTFWPLFHSMPGRASFKEEHWRNYVKVNQYFANKTLEALERCHERKNNSGVPIIWIHDYHLMLGKLKEHTSQTKIFGEAKKVLGLTSLSEK